MNFITPGTGRSWWVYWTVQMTTHSDAFNKENASWSADNFKQPLCLISGGSPASTKTQEVHLQISGAWWFMSQTMTRLWIFKHRRCLSEEKSQEERDLLQETMQHRTFERLKPWILMETYFKQISGTFPNLNQNSKSNFDKTSDRYEFQYEHHHVFASLELLTILRYMIYK